MSRTDENLMLAYCQGEEAAFEELYRRHRERIYFFIRRFISRTDLVEEIYQEAFARLHAVPQLPQLVSVFSGASQPFGVLPSQLP